jgi:hypothetical protein
MTLCKNVGSVDRGFRVVIGIVAVVLALAWFQVMDGSLAGLIAGGIGIILLVTAAIGTCPLYVPLKISTCKPASR